MEEKARLALAEKKKLMSKEKRCQRKTSRSRSPPPPSFFPDYPADGHESGITASDEHVDKMSGCAWRRSVYTLRSPPVAQTRLRAVPPLPPVCRLAAQPRSACRRLAPRRRHRLVLNVSADARMSRARASVSRSQGHQRADANDG